MTDAYPPLLENPLIKRLLALQMPPADYAVFGSGPLLAHQLKRTVHDLDVIARGSAWQRALELGSPVRAPSGNGNMIEMDDGGLQIFDAWTSPDWDVDTLIDEAEVIDGIRFVDLEQVLKWKRSALRAKDIEDIGAIELVDLPGRRTRDEGT